MKADAAELVCQACGSTKQSIGYADKLPMKTHFALLCPICDMIPNWPRSRAVKVAK